MATNDPSKFFTTSSFEVALFWSSVRTVSECARLAKDSGIKGGQELQSSCDMKYEYMLLEPEIVISRHF